LSQYAYDYFFHKDIRTTTIEEHLHELRHIGTSIFEVSKELYRTVEIITNYEKQPLSTLKEELERYKEIFLFRLTATFRNLRKGSVKEARNDE
jgi:hypothetical protein